MPLAPPTTYLAETRFLKQAKTLRMMVRQKMIRMMMERMIEHVSQVAF